GPGPIPAPRAPLGPRAAGPKRLTPVPGAPVSSDLRPVLGSAGAVVEAVGAGSVALTARQSARLTAWCRRHRVTAGEFFAAALADSCARAVGQEEVALLTAVSLRRRYAECVRVSEVGCFVDVVRATVRAGDGGALADHARAYGLAVREADAARHPVRQDHARIRRAVEAETAAAVAGGGLGFRVTQEGCADTALGHHAALVTRYGTTPHGTLAFGPLAHGSVSYGLASYEAEFGTAPWRTPPYATASRKAVHGTSPYEVMHGTGPNGPGYGTSGDGTPYSSSPGTAVHGAAPRPFGVLHLSRFKGALTLSLGMPDLPEMRARAGASTGNGGLNAPEIAAELTARALDLVA
ncbi:hypothetical protein ACFWJM_36500, partial [Streptomyces sp. NPDC127077]